MIAQGKSVEGQIPASTAKANNAMEVDDDDALLEANIASEHLDNSAAITENTQVLKD